MSVTIITTGTLKTGGTENVLVGSAARFESLGTLVVCKIKIKILFT